MNKFKWLVVLFIIYAVITSPGIGQAEESTTAHEVKPTSFELSIAGPITMLPSEVIDIHGHQTMPENATDVSIKWESSNENVATVDEHGSIKALRSGTTMVKGSFYANPEVFREIEVIVKKPVRDKMVKPAELFLAYDALDLMYGERVYVYVNIVFPENAYDQSLKWASSNEKVATVDKAGFVTAVGSGKATIRASFNANPSVFKEIPVFVDDSKVPSWGVYPPVFNIGDEKTIIGGGTGSWYEEKDVVWTTSNPKVIAIKGITGGDAVVKALSPGTSRVTVKYPTGEEYDIWLNVKGPVLAKTIKLNKTSATLKKGKSLKLNATVGDKETANKKVTWSSSNKKVATVDQTGKVTAKSYGDATITAKTSNGITDKAKIHVSYQKTVGIGVWTVGKTIPTGRYKVTTTSKSGHLQVYRKGKRITNVKIGTSKQKGVKKSHTVTLKKGDLVKVHHMKKAEFTK